MHTLKTISGAFVAWLSWSARLRRNSTQTVP